VFPEGRKNKKNQIFGNFWGVARVGQILFFNQFFF
jgi:hypothetical protein